jgi:hypothetical protein
MYQTLKLFSIDPYYIGYKLIMIKIGQEIWETPKDLGNA